MSTSAIFSGTSRFSGDFQQVLQRSVAIASLHLTQMRQQQAELSDDLAAMQSIAGLVRGLKGTLGSIGDSLGKNPWQATVSDAAAVKATVSENASAGSYSIEVLSLGAATTRLSKAPAPGAAITDPTTQPLSAAGSFTFRLDDADDPDDTETVITITPDSATLSKLAEKINEEAGAHVQATVVNVGSSSAPDYRLSLQTKLNGNYNVTLDDGGGNLLDTAPPGGSKAQYKVAGLDSVIESSSRTVTLSPGLTVDLLKAQAGTSVSVTVTRSTDAFASQMDTFVQNYNNTVNEIGRQSDSGASLAGDSMISGVRHMLRQLIAADMGGSGFRTMAELGIEFTQDGTIKFNRTVFDDAVADKFDDLVDFIGTSTESGTGFVKRAFDTLAGIEDTSAGVLGLSIASLQESQTRSADRIAAEQLRIDDLTTNLQMQLTKADALIAMLEQQAGYFTGMFKAMQANKESFNA